MRYRILRRALMMSVAGATVVALAACSGGSGGGGGVAATAGVGTPASGGTVQPTSDPLVFWDLPWGGTEYVAAAKALVAKYTAETGQKVTYQQIPWDNWVQVYVTAVTTNTGPDVTTGGAFLQNRLAMMGGVANLDDMVKTYNYSASDFATGTFDNFKVDGHQVAIPFNADYRGLLYNKAMFDKAGLQPPTTWNEFESDCKALTSGDQYGYVSATASSDGQWTALFWSASNGGSYLDDKMVPNMASDANVQALTFLKRLLTEDKCSPPGDPGYTGADAQKLFLSGKAAMMIASPGVTAAMTAEQKAQFALMPMISSPAGLTQNVGSVNGMMVLQHSNKKPQAEQFLDWWSNNSLSLWTDGAMGAFPARLSVANNAYFSQDALQSQWLKNEVPTTVQLTYPHKEAHVEMDIMDGEHFYASVLQELYTTNTAPMDILKEADQRYQTAIDQLYQSSASPAATN